MVGLERPPDGFIFVFSLLLATSSMSEASTHVLVARYLVAYTWWRVLSAYVGLDCEGESSSGVPPAAIDNRDLQDDDMPLAVKKSCVRACPVVVVHMCLHDWGVPS